MTHIRQVSVPNVSALFVWAFNVAGYCQKLLHEDFRDSKRASSDTIELGGWHKAATDSLISNRTASYEESLSCMKEIKLKSEPVLSVSLPIYQVITRQEHLLVLHHT